MTKLFGPDTRVLDLQCCPNRATEHPTLIIDDICIHVDTHLRAGRMCTCRGRDLGRMQTTDARLLRRPSSSAMRALIISRRPPRFVPRPFKVHRAAGVVSGNKSFKSLFVFVFAPDQSTQFAAILMPVPPRLAATRSRSSSRSTPALCAVKLKARVNGAEVEMLR